MSIFEATGVNNMEIPLHEVKRLFPEFLKNINATADDQAYEMLSTKFNKSK